MAVDTTIQRGEMACRQRSVKGWRARRERKGI